MRRGRQLACRAPSTLIQRLQVDGLRLEPERRDLRLALRQRDRASLLVLLVRGHPVDECAAIGVELLVAHAILAGLHLRQQQRPELRMLSLEVDLRPSRSARSDGGRARIR